MSGDINLNELLRADATDDGCDASARFFERFAEAAAAGLRTDLRFPHTTAHVSACSACREDLAGLVEAIVSLGDRSPP